MAEQNETFLGKLSRAWATNDSTLCIGLDPDITRLPGRWKDRPERIADFCTAIVDATADLACAFKPQIAYFAAAGAESQLLALIEHIRRVAPHVPVILDAKRGDIGPTAQQYAVEAFDRYGADAVTVNPYMGQDTIEPFLAHRGGAVIALCRTSNPGSADLQELVVDGEPLYVRVARQLNDRWGASGNLGLVVGATYPAELRRVRDVVGASLPLLVPGVGAQGADAAETAAAGGQALVVNSSRAILYADSNAETFAVSARRVARETRDALRFREGPR